MLRVALVSAYHSCVLMHVPAGHAPEGCPFGIHFLRQKACSGFYLNVHEHFSLVFLRKDIDDGQTNVVAGS